MEKIIEKICERFIQIAIAFIISGSVITGCGGSGGGARSGLPITSSTTVVAPVKQQAEPAAKKVKVAIHNGAFEAFYPTTVDPSLSGKLWELSGTSGSAFHMFDCERYSVVNGTPIQCNYPQTEAATSQEWSNTHSLWLFATETQPIGDYKVGDFSIAQWDSGVLSSTPTTRFELDMTVLKDDYVAPKTQPAEGGEISCDGAIVIDTTLGGWNYWSLYRVEGDKSRTYIKAVVAQSASSTVIVPVTTDPQNNWPYSYVKPGSYVLELGYGTSWGEPTGDWKDRQIRLQFTSVGDMGTTGYMCQTMGQKIAARTGLKFTEMPSEKEARTPEKKAELTKKAMEEFFSKK